MNQPTPTSFQPCQRRHVAKASIAYFTTVCASVAAAAALVTSTVPLMLGGI